MVSNCDCVNNGTFFDMSRYAQVGNPSYDYNMSMPAVYDNMSYTGSVFDNSTFANTYSGMNGLGCLGSYGFGYGMMPYGPYGDNQRYYDWMYRNQEFNMDYNKRAIKMGRNNEMEINGPNRNIETQMQNLERRIKGDDQIHVKQAWDDYVEAFARMYPEFANSPELASTARAFYERYIQIKNNDPNFSMADQLMQYATPIFRRKFINTVTLGLCKKGSAEETARDITGKPMSEEAQNNAAMGRAAGVVTGLGALAGLIKFRGPIWTAVKNNKIVAGILAIGAAVGLVSIARSE